MIDLHCHFLPGVDDGAKTWEETLAMCRMAYEDGIRTIFATPHFQEAGLRVPRERVLPLVKELRERLEKEKIEMRIFPGNEIYAHPHMDSYVGKKEASTYGDAGQYLLFELPPQGVSLDAVQEMVFRVTLKGITPILAHPERNAMFLTDPSTLAALVAQGVACQVTAGALLEDGGAPLRETALAWFRGGLAHLLATDAHNLDNRKPLLSRAFEVLRNEASESIYQAVRHDNPEAVLSGLTMNLPTPEPEIFATSKTGKEAFSFRRLFRRSL